MKNTEDFVILICNSPNIENAKLIAHILVKEKLAACVNLFNGIISIYEWKGNIEEETEVTLVIKTKLELVDKIENRILELHPYDTPEILQLKVVASNSKYYNWLSGVLKN